MLQHKHYRFSMARTYRVALFSPSPRFIIFFRINRILAYLTAMLVRCSPTRKFSIFESIESIRFVSVQQAPTQTHKGFLNRYSCVWMVFIELLGSPLCRRRIYPSNVLCYSLCVTESQLLPRTKHSQCAIRKFVCKPFISTIRFVAHNKAILFSTVPNIYFVLLTHFARTKIGIFF